jgi:hypothetical protein
MWYLRSYNLTFSAKRRSFRACTMKGTPSSSLTLSSGKSFSSTLLNCQVETLDAAVSIRGRFAANATLTVLITRYFIVIKVLWPRYGNEVLFDVLENFCRKGALEQNL